MLLAGVAVYLFVQPNWDFLKPAKSASSRSASLAAAAMAPATANTLGAAATVLPLTFEPMTTADAIVSNTQWPTSGLPNPPASRFVLAGQNATDRDRAVECLTQAIYYEAGFEPIDGQRAVAQVVLNRLRHPLFPHTVCGVVYQGSELPTGCQFTFTCDGSLAHPPAPLAWMQSKQVGEAALNGYVMKTVGEATHYHANYVVPSWRGSLIKIGQIGAHIFYRWPGTSGTPKAFASNYLGAEPLPKVLFGPLLEAADPALSLASPQGDADAAAAAQPAIVVAAETLTPPPELAPLAPTQGIGALQQPINNLPDARDLVRPQHIGRAPIGSASLVCRPGAC